MILSIYIIFDPLFSLKLISICSRQYTIIIYNSYQSNTIFYLKPLLIHFDIIMFLNDENISILNKYEHSNLLKLTTEDSNNDYRPYEK